MHMESPGNPGVWQIVLEFACHNIITPHIDSHEESHPMASIYHVKPSPKQQDWVDSYKADNELSFLASSLTNRHLYLRSLPTRWINVIALIYGMTE